MTWRSDFENNFWPGHLDFLIYSDSSLEATKSFVVHTPSMSTERLELFNLLPDDSLGSDHLLFVADFRPTFVDTDENGLPDFWEILQFEATGTTQATDDLDFDGSSNIEEFFCRNQSTRLQFPVGGNSVQLLHFSNSNKLEFCS